ncbi:MAG: HEAT repeat domain-containing protein, partial [Gemmatimonadota bacterium]
MRTLASSILLSCVAAGVGGQQPPPRPPVPPTPVIAPGADQRAPKPARTPRPPRPGQWAEAPAFPEFPDFLDFPALISPLAALPPGQWSGTIEEAMREARWAFEDRRHELQAALADRSFEIEHARAEGQWALAEARAMFPPGATWRPEGREESFATTPPAPGRLLDQADSLYRSAREMLNRGEYRRAAAMFSDLSAKHANSAYAADAYYWQAYSLYRIGGTQELRGALDALQAQQTRYPNARTQSDGRTLAMRIRGALAARGDTNAAAQLRGTASDSALRCDAEEQSVRAEALKAIIESDPEGSQQLLQRTLSRGDECSVRLRQTAIFMIGSKRRDVQGVALLSQAARNDPSADVRASALEWLARMPGEDALGTIENLARDTSDERIQRAAVRALVANPSAMERTLVRGIVDRSDVPERLRLEALGAFTKERSTT